MALFPRLLAAPLTAAALLAGCATMSSAPTADVTRFHLGQPIPGDAVTVIAAPGIDGGTLEFRTYAAVVAGELEAVGLRAPAGTARSAYIAVLAVTSEARSGPPKPAKFRIGIGGGTGGYGGGGGFGGVGGGVSLPVGKQRSGDIRINSVGLQIRRRSDNSMIWEGRAVQERAADAPGAALSAAVPVLARALLAGFPGPSGQTVKVKTTS